MDSAPEEYSALNRQECATCAGIDPSSWFDTEAGTTIDLGLSREFLDAVKTCQVCAFIASAYRLQYEGTNKPRKGKIVLRHHSPSRPWFRITGLDSDATSCDYITFESRVRVPKEPEADESRVCLYRLESPNAKPRQLEPQNLDIKRLDVALIKRWLRACRHEHGTVCGRRQWSNWDELGSNGNIFLIDVERRCVVRALPGHRYLALSYVWGETRHRASGNWQWNTTDYGATPFSIALPMTLPQTIEDVLQLADALSERYVWVDFYCINQQDPVHLDSQIKRMSTIYKCAELTLVVHDGLDSESGIAGISRPFTQKRQPRLHTSTGTLIATHLQAPPSEAGASEWDKRAWTMQEYVLSDRSLSLARNKVTWNCKTQILHDCIPALPFLFWEHADTFSDTCDEFNLDKQEPLFAKYSNFLSIYSARLVRNAADASNACQGVLHQLTMNTGAQWVHGLPTRYMPAALAWTMHFNGYLRRRWEFPSWSWLGWQGRSEYTYWLHDAESGIFPASDELPRAIELSHTKKRRREGQDRNVVSLPAAEWAHNQTQLWVTAPMATFTASLVRTNGALIFHESPQQPSKARGDHWSLLDTAGLAMKDHLGEHQAFEPTDYLFRLDPDISALVRANRGEVGVLLLKHYALIRDSEQSGKLARDIITALILLPAYGGMFQRIAAVAMPAKAFIDARPEQKTVKIV